MQKYLFNHISLSIYIWNKSQFEKINDHFHMTVGESGRIIVNYNEIYQII